ncbi:hypothetical protein ACQ4PT_018737 [Festuca glaucescens]
MGANADPSGSLGGPHRHSSPAAVALQHGLAASTAAALRHDPGLARQWSPEEQAVLDDGLAKYALDAAIVRYAKIALGLPNKTVRDVALRCRWMAEKFDSSTKEPAHLARSNVPPYSVPVLPMDDDDGSYKAIGGPTGELLEHNAHLLNQIYKNISNMQVQENLSLLCETRDNILTVLGQVGNAPDIMRQMPPLPVKLNEDLAITVLPRPPHPRT